MLSWSPHYVPRSPVPGSSGHLTVVAAAGAPVVTVKSSLRSAYLALPQHLQLFAILYGMPAQD